MNETADQTIVGNFAIERELAAGGMGVVYVAQHTVTEARVALKLMRPEVARDEAATERFLREVKAAARIGHDGIVKVFDAGRTPDGQLYLAMELLQGETFDDYIARGGHSRSDLLRHIVDMLDPLAAAHAVGIVHRDLKPENIFLARTGDGDTRIKLLDFGIARDASGKSVTATGMALGTPHYMSPEQCSAPSTAGAQADVWSVGVMLYEVLCDLMPFDGETLHAVLLQLSTQPHPPIAERAPWVDAALADLVDRCLSKAPTDRPADATALRDELQRVLADPALARALDGSMTPPASGAGRVSATAATAVTGGALGSAPTQASLADRPEAPTDTQTPMQTDVTARAGEPVPVRRGRGLVLGLAIAAVVALIVSAWQAWPTPPEPSQASPAAQPAQPAPAGAREIRATAILPDPEPPPEDAMDRPPTQAQPPPAAAEAPEATTDPEANDDAEARRQARTQRRRERRQVEAQPPEPAQPEQAPSAAPEATAATPTPTPATPTPTAQPPGPAPAERVEAQPAPKAPTAKPVVRKTIRKRTLEKKRPASPVTF